MAQQQPILNDCDKLPVGLPKLISPCKPLPIFKYENPCRNIYLTKKQKKQKKEEAALKAKYDEAQQDALTRQCNEINKGKEKKKKKGKNKPGHEKNDGKSKNKLQETETVTSSKTKDSNKDSHEDSNLHAHINAPADVLKEQEVYKDGDEEEEYDYEDSHADFDKKINVRLILKRKYAPGDYKYVPSILRDKQIVRKCNDSTWIKRLAYSEQIKETPPKPIILDPSPDYFRRMDEQKTTHCFYSDMNYPRKVWKRHLPKLPRLIGIDKHHLQCFLNPDDTLFKYMNELYPCVKEKQPCLCCLCHELEKQRKNLCFPCVKKKSK